MKTSFDIKKFLIDKRVTPSQLAKIIQVCPDTIYRKIRNNSITISMLQTIEQKFGDCSDYILKESKEQMYI